jgi:hypothetical protein
MDRRLATGRSGQSCEGSKHMRRFRPHCPAAAAGLALGAAAAVAAAHIAASFAAGREEACARTARAAGRSRSPVLQEDGPGRTAAEGSFRANCGGRRWRRDRWRGQDPCRVGRAWSGTRLWCRTPVLYSRVNPRTTKFHCYWGRGRS